MKLTQNQKELLACIKDKEIRKEVKKEFKKQTTFYHTRWKLLDEMDFKDGELKTENFNIQDFLSQHPMNGNLFKEEVEQKFDEFANEFLPNQKGNKIISEEKEKELFLNNQFLQDFLDKCDNLKIIQNFKTKCAKHKNYEYASKFRQKEKDILDTYSRDKLYELVEKGTIQLRDLINSENRKTEKLFSKPEGERIDVEKIQFANDNSKQFTLEDMKHAFAESRLTHPMLGFKHSTFEDYIESLKNPS